MAGVLAVYPGSFDPPTVAHLAIATAALAHVVEVRFVLSEVALGKEGAARTPVERRLEVLSAVVAERPGLSVAVSPARLVVDVAVEQGADAVVLGADKWAQVLDPAWYGGSADERDAAVARLPPTILLAPRAGVSIATLGEHREILVLDVDPVHRDVSSTRARTDAIDLMLPEARRSRFW